MLNGFLLERECPEPNNPIGAGKPTKRPKEESWLEFCPFNAFVIIEADEKVTQRSRNF